MNAKLIFVHALSPLHAGTGQGVGVIDLPIAREKATGIPYLPGSSLKGTLRDMCAQGTEQQRKLREYVFGPETSNAADFAGSAQFSDQRLLLLPIRSLKGTFAWVTSPYLLQRFVRDADSAGVSDVCFNNIPQPKDEQCCVAEQGCVLAQQNNNQSQVILEDLDLSSKPDSAVSAWAAWLGARLFANEVEWQQTLKVHLCVVSDDVLNFLLNTATEITARIKLLADKKTVQQGGLWYEEALPAETILSGLLVATKVKADVNDVFTVVKDTITKDSKPRAVQLGGKATVGKGLCYVRLAE